MEQRKNSTPSRKGKYLNRNERILIEGFLKAGKGNSWIATILERDRGTIRREIARGMTERIHTDLTVSILYNADRAQDVQELNATAKGPAVKLRANRVAVRFISSLS